MLFKEFCPVAVILVDDANNQNLPEYRIGKAMQTCIYPGIRQCFAIAGRRQSFMICTHVSPGATAEDISDTFEHMRALGGAWVSSWYVVGPFADHFSTSTAQWKSAQAIRDTFKTEFRDASADHWVLDVSAQRNRKMVLRGMTLAATTGYLNIKAERDRAGNGVSFSYKGDIGPYRENWVQIYSGSFSRF